MRSLPWLCLVLIACGGGSDPVDGGDAAETCSEECSDGLFCNGTESCDPDDPIADARGCVAGAPPCTAACDEATRACIECEIPDADGDGRNSIECGGDDCDDADSNRYPGNPEICDLEGHDEDCDPNTLGIDRDGDGHPARDCCNVQDDGPPLCGRDCDDTRAGVSPDAADGCGGGDEDCDGTFDEEPDSTYYRDEDADTYGLDDDTVMACALPPGYSAIGGDCIDDPTVSMANQINPGAEEICDDQDNDCDGLIDERPSGSEPCSCTEPDAVEDCGIEPRLDGVGLCRLGSRTCTAGAWTDCLDAIGPVDETCDGRDEDCDEAIDEDAVDRIPCYVDADDDLYGDPATAELFCNACPPGMVENGTDCNDTRGDVFPSAPELCDGVDNDCSSGGGYDPAEDGDADGVGNMGCGGTDCDDTNPNVRPGNFAYYDEPYCVGTSRLPCRDGSTWTCAQSRARRDSIDCNGESLFPFPDVSFDYDCSGGAEAQATAIGCRCSLRCYANIPGALILGAVSAPLTGASVGECGNDVDWITCSGAMCSGLVGCAPPSMTRDTLSCR